MPRFIPRERKHKRLAKQNRPPTNTNGVPSESNASEILPSSKSEQSARRAQLKASLVAPDTRVAGKKRKRLDHYIDTKLRKEENLELIKKLGAHKVDTSLLQSSKKLGRVSVSKRERFGRALREQAAGIDAGGRHAELLYQRRRNVDEEEVSDGQDDGLSGEHSEQDGEEGSKDGAVSHAAQEVAVGASALFGSGLKRPLATGEDGRPAITKRKRRKRAVVPPERVSKNSDSSGGPEGDQESVPEVDENESGVGGEEWNGFDSDPSPASEDSASDAGSDSQTSITSDENEESEESEESGVEDLDKPARTSAFKAWADMQRNAAIGFTPSALPTNNDAATAKASFKARAPSPDPVAQNLLAQSRTSASSKPAAALTIPRSEEIQAARLELPVVQEEQKIMEAIHNNPTVIICGATGSGKTTQVPQMLLENGYGSAIGNRLAGLSSASNSIADGNGPGRGMIGVTQPRRVAAVSVTERVSTELGPQYDRLVAHQVRYDSNVSATTAIKFMTDGILLREIASDFILSRYSAIVIDKAHERSVNTDILIGMLSRIVGLRWDLSKEEPARYYPLKLVIMSATLRVADFAQNERLFLTGRGGAPPIVEAEGRQYPVTVHFSRRTQRDYVEEIVNKVARGHRKLPPGAMLVFLTGQQEIVSVMKKLREALGGSSIAVYGTAKASSGTETANRMPLEMDDLDGPPRYKGDMLEGEDSEQESDVEINGLEDGEDAEFAVEGAPGPRGALTPYILPLYAALPTAQQLKVFQPPPDGSRLIVLATNIAETSLTIPDVRYVFDCGRSKEKKYNTSGVQTFEVDWISKASASQRSGRAGRTGPGHCYTLYSSAVYERYFAEHSVPEVLRTPLESIVLQLKAMDIDNVVNFPFPTPPDRLQLARAEQLLRVLGAIEKDGRITSVGHELSKYPLSPRFGKMLLLGQRNGVLAHTIALVAALAVGDLAMPEQLPSGASTGQRAGDSSDDSEHESQDDRRMRSLVEAEAQTAATKRHQAYTRAQAALSRWDDESDAIKLLTTVAAHAETVGTRSLDASRKFCADFFVHEKGMGEVQLLRQQLHAIVNANHSQVPSTAKCVKSTNTLSLPSEQERSRLKQVVAAGFIDQVAIRADLLPNHTPPFSKPRRAIEVPYRTLMAAAEVDHDRTASLEAQELRRSVFIHPGSVCARLAVKEMPGYIVYSHLSRAAPAAVGDGVKQPKTRMHALTAVSARALAKLAEGSPLLEYGKPIGKIEELAFDKRQCWVGLNLRSNDGIGWPVGAWKVLQKRVRGEWTVEKVIAS